MNVVVNGLLKAGAGTACVVAGVVFLRLYRTGRDRFFLFFWLALWMLGAHWWVLALDAGPEKAHYLYATRALAFLMIIVAVIDKNRRR